MSDDDIRALFHRVDDGPPLGIDVRDVMADGRRVRARRTGLAVTGSVLGAATAAAVAIGLFTGGDPRSPDLIRPADPPTTTSTTSTSPGPPPQPQVPPTGNAPGPGANPPMPEQGDEVPAPGAGTPDVPDPSGGPG